MKKQGWKLLAVLLLCACLSFAAAAEQDIFAYSVLRQDMDGWVACTVYADRIPTQTVSDYPVEPRVSVYTDEFTLIENMDYTVEYFNNDRPGIASARVTMCDDYLGSFDLQFEIRQAEVFQPVASPIPDQTYTGEPIEPPVTVKNGEKTLVSGTDYDVRYYDNENAGTAEAEVTVYGPEDEETLYLQFRILPRNASDLTVSKIEPQNYDGWEQRPYVEFSYKGEPLDYWMYDLTYANNVNPGTATLTASFDGNFTGKRVVKFKIVFGADCYFSASMYGGAIYLSWSDVLGATSYRLYRYDDSAKKYTLLKHTKKTSYTDEKYKQLTTYRYKLVPYCKVDGKSVRGVGTTAQVSTGLNRPELKLKTMDKKIQVTWTKNKLADGYVLYRYDRTSDKEKKIAKLTGANRNSYVDKKVKNGEEYNYTVRAFKKVKGKNVFSEYSEGKSSTSPTSLLAGVKKQKLTGYSIYNVQKSETTLWYTDTLSEEDLGILENFAKKHFKHSWTDEQKLQYTLNWINKNNYYATGSDYNAICSYSNTYCIFKLKKGQCLQYNGAMCAMMTYLGYPSRLIMGYRGSATGKFWQHFWGEALLNGSVYVMETGNYGNSGNWMYFLLPYSQTFGYIKNGKNVS